MRISTRSTSCSLSKKRLLTKPCSALFGDRVTAGGVTIGGGGGGGGGGVGADDDDVELDDPSELLSLAARLMASLALRVTRPVFHKASKASSSRVGAFRLRGVFKTGTGQEQNIDKLQKQTKGNAQLTEMIVAIQLGREVSNGTAHIATEHNLHGLLALQRNTIAGHVIL